LSDEPTEIATILEWQQFPRGENSARVSAGGTNHRQLEIPQSCCAARRAVPRLAPKGAALSVTSDAGRFVGITGFNDITAARGCDLINARTESGVQLWGLLNA
jgi:hypothetical protein